MKKPGLKKRRPPGGGAAGRAYQFGHERDTDTETANQPENADKPKDKSGASKKPKRKARVPKKPK